MLKIWTNKDDNKPLKEDDINEAIISKKPIDPVTLENLYSLFEDGFYNDKLTPNPDNKEEYLQRDLSEAQKSGIRAILKTRGNLRRLAEIENRHVDTNTKHVDTNTQLLVKLTIIQIVVETVTMLVSLTMLGIMIYQYWGKI